MLLENDLLTLSMGMGLKLPPFINPKCGKIGWPCGLSKNLVKPWA